MLNEFSRTQLLLGPEALEKLAHSRVAVFGIGGVGGYTVEALARSGVGALDLIDDDKVCLTNINRQILATRKTVGKHKVDVAAERIGEINPRCVVRTYKTFYLPDTAKYSSYWRLRRLRRRSSAPWAQATSWTPPLFVWRILRRPRYVRWPVSCGGN